jgi:hypothetical protein
MWEFTSGVPPFNDRPHDYHLSLSICGGKRPEIVENTPSYYIDLMKECWNPEPAKRPTLKILENIITEWLDCFNRYVIIKGAEYIKVANYVTNISNSQLLDIMREFSKDSMHSIPKQANTFIVQSHPQAYYKSRLLEKVDETSDQNDKEVVFSLNFDCMNLKSECLDCEISVKSSNNNN